MTSQNNTPRPAQSFGSVQETFRYRFSGKKQSFNSGDQFSIVEDMPRQKLIRTEFKKAKRKDGTEFDAETKLIRVICRGYEADMEVYPDDIPKLALLCPKGLENFKGCTFVFDGYNWAYMGIETPQAPISTISQAMAPPRDPRQPDLNPAPDQRDLFVGLLVNSIKAFTEKGEKVDAHKVMEICENMTPGKAMDLFAYAKGKGAISEKNGVWKVN